MLRSQVKGTPFEGRKWFFGDGELLQNPHPWPGLRKTRFFSKKTTHLFFGVFQKKKKRFCCFFKENRKTPFWIVLFHHALSLFSEVHNKKLLHRLWHSKLRVKKCTPSLFSQCVVGQFTPKWKGLARMPTAIREKPLPRKLRSFTSRLCTCLVSSASIEFIFSIYDLEWSKIKKSLDAEKAEKWVKIYRFCRAEEDNH